MNKFYKHDLMMLPRYTRKCRKLFTFKAVSIMHVTLHRPVLMPMKKQWVRLCNWARAARGGRRTFPSSRCPVPVKTFSGGRSAQVGWSAKLAQDHGATSQASPGKACCTWPCCMTPLTSTEISATQAYLTSTKARHSARVHYVLSIK